MSRTELELRPFLGSNTAAVNVATGLLSQLRDRTGPNKPHQLDPNGRMALPAIAALLACEKLQIQDLDLKTAQRNSHVSAKHFTNALSTCRFAVAASSSSSNPNSPASRTPGRASPGGARTPTRASPAHASGSQRRGATVSFFKLGQETLDEVDQPQKVVVWAETVKQRLREEEGVSRMVDLDGEDEMRGIWGWVCQAWGVKSPSLPTSRLLRLLETHLSALLPQISAASPHAPAPSTPTRSTRTSPTKPTPTTSTPQPTTPTKSSSATRPSALSPTKSSRPTTPTKSLHPPPSTPTSSRTNPTRTPSKPTPLSAVATPTSRSSASQSHAHTPTGRGSPLKRQVRHDSPPVLAGEGERTPTASRTPTRSGTRSGAAGNNKRKYAEDSDDDNEGSGSDDELALRSGRKVPTTPTLQKGKGKATPTSTLKAKPGEKKRVKTNGRRYKSYIDGVGGGEEMVERGWKRYLAWREVHLLALDSNKAAAVDVDVGEEAEGEMDIDA